MATKDSSKSSDKSYLAKDFTSFREDLLAYARNYFPDKISDFSEASLGGLLMEMAAYIGDTMSFYLDYQYNELDPIKAIETDNIITHATNAGVTIVGAAPSVCDVTFYIEVPSKVKSDGTYEPDSTSLPIIGADSTVLTSGAGINFSLSADVDFGELNIDGVLDSTYIVSEQNDDGTPSKYILTKVGTCISGRITSDLFSIPNTSVPFRKINLVNQDVTDIISVTDSDGNEFYKVDALTQDVVFKKIQNLDKDQNVVISNLEVTPAPFRYIAKMDFRTRITTLQFGSGDADSLDDDIIPDPSELALPLYGKKTFARFAIDPNSLLKTKTLGISPKNTTITVQYRYGGGISHNVASETIRSVQSLGISFPYKPSETITADVTDSFDVKNKAEASGGASALTIDDIRAQIPIARNYQGRMVTQQDLLARIYTLPPTFGRVYRAGLRKSEDNPLASQLYILCQRSDKTITIAPDALKLNLRTYLNEFRLISDAVDILDGTVVNYGINFNIIITPSSNKSTVVAATVSAIKNVTDVKYYQVDQPILEADIINAIINTTGVLSLVELALVNKNGTESGRVYSEYVFDLTANTFKGLVVGPIGSIFEIKFPDDDIVGTAE